MKLSTMYAKATKKELRPGSYLMASGFTARVGVLAAECHVVLQVDR